MLTSVIGAFQQHLALVRARGYASTMEEHEIGLAAVAPVTV